MCVSDTRFSTLLEQFIDDLQSSNEDIRRQATNDLYERIIAQYIDVLPDVVQNLVAEIQIFVRQKMSNPNAINENRAALLVILCFICAGQNFYTELSNKLETTLRGYKQMSVDPNLCELLVKLTCLLVKGCDRLNVDRFSLDILKALEYISPEERHEIRRYTGIQILKEIAITAPLRYYHLITPIEQYFEQLFNTMIDSEQYIREAFAETMKATLIVLIDHEDETFLPAYHMAYKESMACLENNQNEDEIHGGLLLLNELLRVSDIQFENICQTLSNNPSKSKRLSYKDIHRSRLALTSEQTDPLSPINIMDNINQSSIQVQSSLMRSILLKNLHETCHQIFPYLHQLSFLIANVLIRILPRLASLDYEFFSQKSYIEPTMNFIFDEINSSELNQRQLAFHALGLMIRLDSDHHIVTKYMTKTIACLKQTFISNENSLSCRYSLPDASIFACITLIGGAGRETSKYLNNLLEYLLNCQLNHSLLICLKNLCSMPWIVTEFKQRIYQGLLENLRLILCNPLAYQSNLSKDQFDLILIALETFRMFNFEIQAIEPTFIDTLHCHFIQHDNVHIRIESIKIITHLLQKLLPFIASMNKIRLKISLIIQILLNISVTDSNPDVRYNVLLTLYDNFNEFLVKSEVLELLFYSINDQSQEINELAVSLLGRLSNLNPGYILPRLKHVLYQLLTQLVIERPLSETEQTLRLLGQLITNTPRIVKAYMKIITQVLLRLIKRSEQHSNAFITLIRTIGDYAHICSIGFHEHIHDLFPILINMLQDTSNIRKREVALWTTGQIIESCCYVIDPLKDYPILLDILLKFLKSDEISVRRQTIRLLGFIGAIDPYHIRSSNDSFDVNDITLIHRLRNKSDPIELSSNELIITSTNQSLPDFYTSIVIYSSLRILKDSNHLHLHLKSLQSLTKIFQWLGNNSTQYVSLVFPCLLSIVHNTDQRNLIPFCHQMNLIILSIKISIVPFINDILQLIEKYWNTNIELQILLLHTTESLVMALGDRCHEYIHLLLPFILKILCINTTNLSIKEKDNRQLILSRMFLILYKFDTKSKPYLNTVLLQILHIASDDENSNQLRNEALITFEQLVDKVFINDHISGIIQALLTILRHTFELQIQCLDLICILAQHMGKHFLIFHPSISKIMNEMNLQYPKYELFISKLKDSSSVDIPTIANETPNLTSSAASIVNSPSILYTIRTKRLREHWLQAMPGNTIDISTWFNKFQQLVLEQSPIYSLRAMGTCLAEHSSSISKDLFNVSFVSCWSVLNAEDRSSLTEILTYVLSVCEKADVIQIILNLVEFYDHCYLKLRKANLIDENSNQSLIDTHLLIKKAISVRAYAKALRYQETEFENEQESSLVTSDTVESLISINYELQQSEAAYGALAYAKIHQIEIKDLWYEKLNQWERALRHYESIHVNDPLNFENNLGRMRCMQALGSWNELRNLTNHLWNQTEQIHNDQKNLPFTTNLIEKYTNTIELRQVLQETIAPIATRAAWSVGNLTDMEKYSLHISDTKFEGIYYRAINAIRNDNYRQAYDSIDLARELLDEELTTLTNESYNRAYSAMINTQLLSELEEVWTYKTNPERRPLICTIWQKRLQGNQPIVDDYHRSLLTHSLCLPMREDLQLWIKLANLCHRSNRLIMAEWIFKQLVKTNSTDQNRDYHAVVIQYEKAKYDWHCLIKSRERLLSQRQIRKQALLNVNSIIPANIENINLKLEQNHQDQLKLLDDVKEMINKRCLSKQTLHTNQNEQHFRQLTSKCYLRLGTWQHELFGMTNDDIIDQIMKNYEHACTYDESNHKAWNAHAVFNYETINHLKQSNEMNSQSEIKIIHCTISSMKSLLKSIVLSKSKHCLQDTLRLLTLLFEYGQYQEVYDIINEGIHEVPIEVWLQVLPQLIARIDSSELLIRQFIQRLLMNIGQKHSQALIYPLVVASKSVVRERSVAANIVLNHMKGHSSVLVQQAIIVSDELIRISILWHEKWYDGLANAINQYEQHKNVVGMINALILLHSENNFECTTLSERSFVDLYANDLRQAYDNLCSFHRTRNPLEFQLAFQLYFQVYQRIHTQLRNMTSLELDQVSPQLTTHCRDLELAVPGTYEPYKPSITIQNMHSQIKIITSKQRPRKISMQGSDGFQYVFLLKGHEDLRQDERVMQLFGLVNEFLSVNEETRRQNFNIQRYPVIPLALNTGLLGWVTQCETFHTLIKDYREKAGIVYDIECRHIQKETAHYEQLPLINKIEIFEYAISLLKGNDLAKILWYTSSSAEIWLVRRANYTKSLAIMSMVGYILGLGDRHLSNLMLDHTSGKVVHIDFGDCFEIAMKREKFAERVPFRLTRMLCKAMEITGIDGTFRMTCEHVMGVLRTNRDSLMTVLEAFIHDPLLNWRLVDEHGSTQQNQKQNIDIQTVEVINRVRDKLIGNDFHREEPVDISTQVELLIKQATSHENLCQSYLGWCPFW
ncbi:hypothetical protein I4U23_012201 [Adineta vaga]|nr:hypothetical protein I4U23_012201 [Adineta vaga]